MNEEAQKDVMEKNIEREVYRDKDGTRRSGGDEKAVLTAEEIQKEKEQQKRIKRMLDYTSGTGGNQKLENDIDVEMEREDVYSNEERKQFEQDLLEEIGFNSF